MPDTSVHRLPFSAEANSDGARFVWFANCRAGLPYAYVRTVDVPGSRSFTEIDSAPQSGGPRGGDIAWWPTFMGTLVGRTGPVVTPEGPLDLVELRKRLGAPRFFRRIVVSAP